jgi:uncharacterized protein (DUF58 family)
MDYWSQKKNKMESASPQVKVKNHQGLFPTGSGLILILVVGAMLVGATNYSNNMAYIFCFLLISLILVSVMYTRNNLDGLEIKSIQPQPAFAGGSVRFYIDLSNVSLKNKVGVYLALPDCKSVRDFYGPFNLEPNSVERVELEVSAPKRGLYTLSHLNLITVYPLGLVSRWKKRIVSKEYLIYPQPYGSRSWPTPSTMWREKSEGFHISGGDDFTGLRPYREGESQHHVDWKAFARGRPLSVKEFSGGGAFQMWFDWNILTGLGTEERLSQLTRWVLEADQLGREFGLKLPKKTIKPDFSTQHTLGCLKELAIFNN